jgi:hypothetical protein
MRTLCVVVGLVGALASTTRSLADTPASTPVSEANEVARAAYFLSTPDPRVPKDTSAFVGACLRVKACSETCRPTILGITSSKSPGSDCPEAKGKSPAEMVEWIKARFLRVMIEAKTNVDAEHRDYLECASARLLKVDRVDACVRLEPKVVSQRLAMWKKMAPGPAASFAAKECANLEGCATVCAAEIRKIVLYGTPVEVPPATSKCTELAAKPSESPKDWAARVRPLITKRIETYYRGIVDKVPEAERATVRENLKHAGF